MGFCSSFVTGSKNTSTHRNRDDGRKKIWSSSFSGLGIVVWKFNTNYLFSEAGLVKMREEGGGEVTCYLGKPNSCIRRPQDPTLEKPREGETC